MSQVRSHGHFSCGMRHPDLGRVVRQLALDRACWQRKCPMRPRGALQELMKVLWHRPNDGRGALRSRLNSVRRDYFDE